MAKTEHILIDITTDELLSTGRLKSKGVTETQLWHYDHFLQTKKFFKNFGGS